jgi:predicted DNA-binding protein with PD1-like motif
MKSTKKEEVHIILIERGERIIEKLTAYCKEHKISAGFFTGIGAVDDAEIAHYIVDNKKYSSKVYKEPMEICTMSGNISIMDGEPYIHAHIILGKENFSVIGGHLKEATVHAVCEVYLVEVAKKIERKRQESIGLNVWSI